MLRNRHLFLNRHQFLIIQFVCVSLSTSITPTICTAGQNLNLSFPELDPPSTPSGPQYTQMLAQSDEGSFTIHMLNDSYPLLSKFPPTEYFLIEYNSTGKGYYISMVKGVDRDGPTPSADDDVNVLQYQVICQEKNISAVYSVLNIHITDVNDNDPVFTESQYTTTISELTVTGIYEGFSATDLDAGENKRLVYNLSASPQAMFDGSKYFTMSNDQRGSINLSAQLDFESMYLATNHNRSLVYFNVTVTARDQGSPARSSSAILIINILDADDQGPTFLYQSCIISSEGLKPLHCIRPKYRSSVSLVSVQAEESKFYRRTEYASIVVAINDSSPTPCPAGYSTDKSNNGMVMCVDSGISLVLGLGLALGFACLIIIIILVVVGVVLAKRRKPSTDKSVHDYNTVDISRLDRHSYQGFYSNGTDSRTSGYVEPTSDRQSEPRYYSPTYVVLIDGSVIRRGIPGDGSYANDTGDGSYANDTGDGNYANDTGDGNYANGTGDDSYANDTGDGSCANDTGDV